MRKIAFISLAICGLLMACGPKINETQEKQLASLTQKIDSIALIVNSIDSAKMTTMLSNFYTKKAFFQEEMEDTLDRETIFKLDAFIQLRKGMGFLSEQYSQIKREANIMKQQLVDLNHDVEKKLIEEKKFDKYYTLEKDNYEQLRMAAGRLVEVSKRMESKYYEYLPMVDSIETAYKEKQDD